MPRPNTPSRSFRTLVAITVSLVVASTGAALAHGDRAERRPAKLAGTVTSIDAPRFTLGLRDEQSRVVTTDARTRFAKTVDATVGDATPGSFVVARGRVASDASLAAHQIGIRPEPREGGSVAHRKQPDRAGDDHVHGTVVANDGSTIIVRTPSGGHRRVTTTDDTRVTRTFPTEFDALQVDDRVRLIGTANEDGTISARGVHIWAVSVKADRAAAADRPRPAASPPRQKGAPQAGPARVAPTGAVTRPDVVPPLPSGPDHRPTPAEGGVGGVVESVDAPNFTLATGGRKITVSTTDKTTFRKTLDATLADADTGSIVTAMGRRDVDGSLSAASVHVHPGDFAPGDRCDGDRCVVTGEVIANDATAGTLTLSTARGSLLVRTGGHTRFTQTLVAAFADLAVGQRVWARGTRTETGTFAADGVRIDLTTAGGRGTRDSRDRS